MKALGGIELWLQSFFVLALDGAEWSASGPPAVPVVKNSGADYVGDWLGPSAGLDFWMRDKFRASVGRSASCAPFSL